MQFKQELKTLIQLAWPLLIAQITQTLMGVSDTIIAGRYSAIDMAAVAIGFSITIPILLFIQGVILALPPVISRHNGAKTIDKVANITQQMVYLAVAVSLLALALNVAMPTILTMIPMDDSLRDITQGYVHYILLAAPAFAIYQVLRNFCEGLSFTKPTMIIMVMGLLINIPANYLFVYGFGPIPAFGGAGCGIATALVHLAMMLATVGYVYHSKKLHPYHLFSQWHKPQMREIKVLFKLGVPIAMTILFEVSLFAAVAVLLAPFGAVTVAAHQIALNFSALMFMLPFSIGMATSIRVGHLIGEERQVQAAMVVKGAIFLGICIAAASAALTYFGRFGIASLYSQDSQVITLAAGLMLFACMFQFSDAMQAICLNALRGYKDTTAMFLITFTAYWLVGLPAGCLLALTDIVGEPLQAKGFWIGFIIGLTSAAIMLVIRLRVIQRRQQLGVYHG